MASKDGSIQQQVPCAGIADQLRHQHTVQKTDKKSPQHILSRMILRFPQALPRRIFAAGHSVPPRPSAPRSHHAPPLAGTASRFKAVGRCPPDGVAGIMASPATSGGARAGQSMPRPRFPSARCAAAVSFPAGLPYILLIWRTAVFRLRQTSCQRQRLI